MKKRVVSMLLIAAMAASMTAGCGKSPAAMKSGGSPVGHPVKWFWSTVFSAAAR